MLSAILDRLKLMHDEIPTLTPFREPPPIIQHEWMLSGAMLYVVHIGFSEEYYNPAQMKHRDNFAVDVLVKPIGVDQLTTAGYSQNIAATHVWIQTLYDYYNQHRWLTTNAIIDPLVGVYQGMTIQCDGVVLPLTAHDQQQYVGTQFTLAIDTFVEVPRLF